MLRGDIRTLLILANERPPLETVAEATGVELRPRGRDAYTLVCSDGSSAALNFWRFERPQDHVSKTVLSLAARFRARELGSDAERRRNRVLIRVQRSKVSLVVGAPGKLSSSVLRFVDALAQLTDALVYDFTSLHRASGEKLVDVNGYVTEDIPRDYPELPAPAKAVSSNAWTDAPMVLTWLPEDEVEKATTSSVGGVSRVLVESVRDREELVDRLHDLRERIGRTTVSTEVEDRRNRLSFMVARATGLIEASDPPMVAREVQGISFIGAEARDELGRLVLSTSGAQDVRALSPRDLLLLSRDASSVALGRAEEDLRAAELSVSVTRKLDGSFSRLAALALEFIGVSLELGPDALRRHHQISQFLTGAITALNVSARRPMELEQIEDVRRCAESLNAITFDGWGFFDTRRRALLVRSGAVDPAARIADSAVPS